MARLPRLTLPGYPHHIIQRGNNRQPIFASSADYEALLALIEEYSKKFEVAIHSYVLMSNHFHLLCEVPVPRPLSQSEMLERIEAFYGPQRAEALRQQLARYAEQPNGHEIACLLLAPFRMQMNDISFFFKVLKGRFAQWYNRRHGRSGVLWAEALQESSVGRRPGRGHRGCLHRSQPGSSGPVCRPQGVPIPWICRGAGQGIRCCL